MTGIASLFDGATLIVSRREAPGAGGIPLPEGARVVPLSAPAGSDVRRKLSVLLGLPYYLAALVREFRAADVVHVPPPGDIPLLGLLLGLAMRKRLIVRYAGSWADNAQTSAANRVAKNLMRRYAGGRNVMLATGEGSQPPAPGMHWIFSTALTKEELLRIQPRLDRGIARPARIVYIGRLSPEKGVATLIGALGRLRAAGKQVPHLTVIGDGPERRALAASVARLDLGETVEFAGQLDRGRLSRALLEADFCVQPSLTEGFSKAWLDAFAHGLPVLASDVGAARGVMGNDGERGWTVRPGDSQVLADRLETILSRTTEWPALRHRCREFVESRTVDAWASRIGTLCAEQWGVTLDNGKLRERR
jgi:glycosyltransferase involved in cell wall biosynthesis